MYESLATCPDELLLFMSEGRTRSERIGVDPERGVDPEMTKPAFDSRWDALIDDRSVVFVADATDRAILLPEQLLRRRLAARKLSLKTAAAFSRPDGRPVWLALEVARR